MASALAAQVPGRGCVGDVFVLYREELHFLDIAWVQKHNRTWQEEEARQQVDIHGSLQWTVLRKAIQMRKQLPSEREVS